MMKLSSMHPITSTVYFASVLLISMFVMHPLYQVMAFAGGFCYYAMLKYKRITCKEITLYVVLFLLISATNPLFSHNGITVLFYMNNNPVTLESLLYGTNLAIMLLGILIWFKCLSIVLTEDKMLCVFGRISPKIALLISITLRFIPLLSEQSKKVRNAQKAMGMYSSEAWIDKIRSTMRVYSSVIGWAIENAVYTGNSMKARGYGIGKRTSYNDFKFSARDCIFISVLVILNVAVYIGITIGKTEFSFYPEITVADFNMSFAVSVGAFCALSFLPFILELKEDIQWKFYRSRI